MTLAPVKEAYACENISDMVSALNEDMEMSECMNRLCLMIMVMMLTNMKLLAIQGLVYDGFEYDIDLCDGIPFT